MSGPSPVIKTTQRISHKGSGLWLRTQDSGTGLQILGCRPLRVGGEQPTQRPQLTGQTDTADTPPQKKNPPRGLSTTRVEARGGDGVPKVGAALVASLGPTLHGWHTPSLVTCRSSTRGSQRTSSLRMPLSSSQCSALREGEGGGPCGTHHAGL